ncbi:NAD+ synthase [Mycoplasma crocodyli]|uniref:NH(3)-dependent NAD(+) synthetase n=1 Tax=Mycoplasma crocodyli (strain ATCC 51981 / MP145) TaxID=512564 RepID=D5E5X7_MYCCM|nr:NAD+ synthase [Mycoplasma crocodyli]ADE19614.1 NAD+ synthetase [Mycoplasma crocodyli MP145]
MNKITKYVNEKRFYDEKVALQYIEYLADFIKNKVNDSGLKGAVVGISGGIDSALVAALAKKALGKNLIGVVMPINDMSFDFEDINELEKSLDLKFININLKETNETINKELKLNNSLAKANIMPRLRMTTLYAIAQENNSLVLGTDNKDEFHVGYFTKYGDGGVDLLPICHLTKGEVRYLSSLLNIPSRIINKKPSAGLWQGQNDEDEMGFNYDQLDYYLDFIEEPKKISRTIPENIVKKIEKMHNTSEHKRVGAYKPLDVEKFKQGE